MIQENLSRPGEALSEGDTVRVTHPDGVVEEYQYHAPPSARTTVSARRFTHELLGLTVYGGLLTARDGLRAQFAANQASEAETQQLTLLNAADRLVMQGDLELSDPAVALVLDFAVANPYIAFTPADKERVLNNQPLGEAHV